MWLEPCISGLILYWKGKKELLTSKSTCAMLHTRYQSIASSSITVDEARNALARHDLGCAYYGPPLTNLLNCKLSQKCPNKGRTKGYVKIKITGRGRKEYYLHHLALIANGRGAELSLLLSGSHQVSHLCHQPNCFNPDHLKVETAAYNLQRSHCQGLVVIAKCPSCSHTFSPCKHEPRCMLLHFPQLTDLNKRRIPLISVSYPPTFSLWTALISYKDIMQYDENMALYHYIWLRAWLRITHCYILIVFTLP